MQNKISQTATSIWQKIALVLFGLILSLLLLEAGMRLGGFVLASIQEYGNLQSIMQKGAYRILCIGESTTQGQYPHLLEQVLNKRDIGVHFSVIDKGKAAKSTLVLMDEIEFNLAEYHPDMVVAMMGINDEGRHMPREMLTTSGGKLFIRSLRTYKLARLLWLHLLKKAEEMGIYKPILVPPETPLPITGPEKTSVVPALVEGFLKKKVADDDNAYVNSGWLSQEQGKFPEAEEAFKKAIEINPKNDRAYFALGALYRGQGKFAQAKDSFQKAVEINPKNGDSYVGLGVL